jgi:hypothetical protein
MPGVTASLRAPDSTHRTSCVIFSTKYISFFRNLSYVVSRSSSLAIVWSSPSTRPRSGSRCGCGAVGQSHRYLRSYWASDVRSTNLRLGDQ